jgi:signal transduction histidine kinase
MTDGLHALADELRRNTMTEIIIRGQEPEGLPLTIVADLLAIAREALANVARHAKARNATVQLTTAGGVVRLEISDDGRGLRPDETVARGHNGLANMRARAEALGGTFEIESGPAAGTRIIVAVPKESSRRGGRP